MKVLVTGKNGQLGKSIKTHIDNKEFNKDFKFVGRKELDLSDINCISKFFLANNFDIIINCAAYTEVDKAESEPVIANQINNLAAEQLAEIANNEGAKLIHISTDYVFDGENSAEYVENDLCRPINVYGETKLAGEEAILSVMRNNAIIIRTSWLYSEYGNNFFNKILKLGCEKKELKIVCDQTGSPTYAGDLAGAIINIVLQKELINKNFVSEIYHYSNIGQCSWYEFTKKIFKLSSTECIINPITTDQYPTPAKRPAFTALNKDKIINKFDIKIPTWGASLEKCIADSK